MARHHVIHSADACTILIRGDKRRPEPGTAVIKFPGGYVEVSRTSDGRYWCHFTADDSANVVESRVNYSHEEYARRLAAGEPSTSPIPAAEHITHLAVLMQAKVISNPTDFE